jgi:hypothetical protein
VTVSGIPGGKALARLVVTAGLDRGLKKEIRDLPITIGHDALRDINLKDDRVSRLHATVHLENNRLVLSDMGSTNGTFVNDAFVSRAILRDGDTVRLGDTRIRYEETARHDANVDADTRAVVGSTHTPLAAAKTAHRNMASQATQFVASVPADICDVGEVLTAVIRDVQPFARRRAVKVDLHSSSGVQVQADRSILESLLSCLTSTSVEYMSATGAARSLTLSIVIREREGIVAIVADCPDSQRLAGKLSKFLDGDELAHSVALVRATGGEVAITPGDATPPCLFRVLLRRHRSGPDAEPHTGDN